LARFFYLDASALAKRYVPEKGSPLVDIIFDTVPAKRMHVLIICTAEVVSILVRKRNAGALSVLEFGQAMANFQTEIIRVNTVNKVSVTSRLVTGSFALIVAHSINATDAVTLKSAMAIARKLRSGGDQLVVVASDLRLLRAAQAEGLLTFNPETQDQAAIAALVGS